MMNEATLKIKYQRIKPKMDERTYRLCLGSDALAIGRGGVARVSRASGASPNTVKAGIRDIEDPAVLEPGRVRRPGAGGKPITETDETLLEDLMRLVDPITRGDPTSALRWSSKSTSKLATELRAMGHKVSQPTVWRMLDELGYSMQSNRKSREGSNHPDRDEQFEFINASAKAFLKQNLPVISVDTKKKELVGPYKNGGKEWQKKGEPVEVNMHDFPDPRLGKVIPYGVYDVGRNEGWVSVGISHDTAKFAVSSIRRWWYKMGKRAYGDARQILITADCGGSNGARVRLWKVQLQELANELGMSIHVRHFPPGTSKWNKIEHRMFCHITENWRGRPLIDRVTIVNLISSTRTGKGLVIRAELDRSEYETGTTVTKEQMEQLAIEQCEFHGEWNYSIHSQSD